MSVRFLYILFYSTIMVFHMACSKGNDSEDDSGNGSPHVVTPNDSTAPEISILTPTTNQVFANGGLISITGKITDDFGLYRGTIRIVNDATGNVLLNQAYEIHGLLLYNFSINHTVSTLTATDYTITVSFEDHGLNVTAKSVKVKVAP